MVFTSLPPPSTAGLLRSGDNVCVIGVLGGLIETACIKELLKLQSPKDIITDNNHFIFNKIIS